nr:Gag-Pol polyprotein [Tanacetum cinerariifolium]
MHNNIMAAGLKDHPPMRATGRYAQWKSRFLRCIDTRPNGEALKKCILQGPYTPSTVIILAVPATDDTPADPKRTTVETILNMNPENKAHYESEKEAIHLLLIGIGDEIYSTVNSYKTAYKMQKDSQQITPPSESAFEEDSAPEQAQKDNEIRKNMALIAKYFKKLYKPTNNNLRTSSNSRNKNLDTFIRYVKDNETGQFGNQRTVTVVGAKKTIGSQLADTDKEIGKQELEAHCNYMAKIQKHYEQPESISNTCVVEKVDSNVIPDSPDMCDNDIQSDQNAEDERFTLANLIKNLKLDVDENKRIQKQLKKANTSLAHKLKECKSILVKLVELWGKKHSISLKLALKQYQEQMKNDTVCKEKPSNVFLKEREQYFEIQDLKAQLQDKNIAISELKKLIEKCKGKYVETKFDKPYVVRQPTAQRISKPSVLGKPTPFSDSLERKSVSKTKSVPKTNMSEGLSKPVTTQNLPQIARQALRSTQKKDKVMQNNSQVKFKKTEVEDHHRISSISNQTKSVTACNDSLKYKTSNVNVVHTTCGKCMFNSNHDACVSKFLNDVNARTKKPKVVPISTRRPKSQANNFVATPLKKTVILESVGNKMLKGIPTASYDDSTASALCHCKIPHNLWCKPYNKVSLIVALNLFKVTITLQAKRKQAKVQQVKVAQPKMTSFAKIAHLNVKRPFQGKSTVRTPPRVLRVSNVSKKFPTIDSKFPTAKSTFTADLGNKGKAIKASACWIWRPKQNTTEKDFKLKDDTNVLLKNPRQHNMYSIDLNNIVPHKNLTCFVAKASVDESMLWHRRCDNGEEFKNKEMNKFYTKKGIRREFSDARTPQQNRVAKRRNRTLIEAARTIPFGCHVMILNTLDHLGKFDAKGDEDYFVGYSMSSKAFRVFNKRTKKVEENPHVDFLENKLIKKGASPNWLFDIDTLTNSINYVPVVVAGTSSTNISETRNSDAPNGCNAKVFKSSGISNPTATLKVSLADQVEPAVSLTVESVIPTTQVQGDGRTKFIATIHYKTNPDLLQFCLFSCFLSEEEPKKIFDALKDPSWVEAMQEELLQFKIQNFWILVDCPKGVRPIGIKWVLKNKKDKRGILIRNKARLVAQGYTQEEGIDYEEVFTPIARIEAIRLFLAYASFMGFIVYQMDVKSAFLYGSMNEEVYVMKPLGFQDPEFPNRVYKVEKAISMIRSLMYLTASRLDIMFAVCACARHQVTPKECHLHAIKRIFRYLKGHLKLGLWYPKESPFNLVAYSDSDYGGATQDRKSTTGGCQFLGRRKYTRRAIRIAQSKALSPAADEPASLSRDDRQERLSLLQQSQMTAKIKDQDLEISGLKARVKSLKDKERRSAEPTQDSMEAANILTSEGATASVSPVDILPTVGVPTVSGGKEKVVESEVPKKRKLQEQIDAQVAREMEEEFARENQRASEQLARDSEIARLYAEEELKMMIEGLDRSNKVIAKHLKEYEQAKADLSVGEKLELISELVKYQDHRAKILKYQAQQSKPLLKKEQRDFYMAVLRSHAGWKTKHFRGMTMEQIKENFIPVWKQHEDFVPMSSKEEDFEDQLWTHNQAFIHDPLDWKLYDTCGVHHVFTKDQEIFILVEKDYPLRKGLATVMIFQDEELIEASSPGKAKRSLFKTKVVSSSKGRLNLLYIELCGPMRVARINGKKYILASDYDNSDLASQLQHVSSSVDTTALLQQELDLLFGPLYDDFSIQIFVAYAAYKSFLIYHIDVKMAFPNGPLKEEAYIVQPDGFVDPDHLEKVYRLSQALYAFKTLDPPIPKRYLLSTGYDCTVMSSAEAEYMALSTSCAQLIWMRTQLKDYGFNYNKISLYCGS